MSQPSPSTDVPRKSRNPVERVVVRVGIVLLLGVVYLEYRAKQGYDTTLQNLQNVTDGTRDVTMEEARRLMVGYSTMQGPTPNAHGFPAYTYSWLSLFRSGTYRLTLVASKDGTTLRTFDGPGFAEDPAVLAARAEEHANAPDGPPPIFSGSPPETPPPATGESAASEQPAERQPEAARDSAPAP
jgi:hypothetical protein